ncbi:MAG: fimbrillin family protein [Bacteroidaceae bacterium]|nr:fimbrillin family protein [Bacteroidaceae bacterium]
MNKKLYLLATVAIFAACSSNDVKNDIQESNNEIGFDALTYKTTRAEITSNANLASEGGFIVWGYKAKNQATMDWTVDKYTVFNGVNVTSSSGTYISGNETNWTYTSKKYWDKNASYCFYAVAPSGGSYSIAGATNNVMRITITGAASGDASAAGTKDYLISRAGVIDRKGTDQSNVDFTFNHVMAKVDFLLKKAATVTGEVKVQSITMTGWDGGNGTFVQTLTASPNNELSHTEWTIPNHNTSASATVLSSETAALGTDGAKNGTNTFIMVPQTIAADALTFTINFTVDGEPFNAQVGHVTTQQIWGTDSHITYTLTIAPAAIEFDVASIAGFSNTGTGAATIPVQ